MTIKELLQASFAEATNRLVPFTATVRGNKNDMQGKYSISQKDLDSLFDTKVWKEASKGGHRKLKNLVTGVIVEYKNHDNRGGIDPGAVLDIFQQVQTHLNILHNQVFAYQRKGWSGKPDYNAAVKWISKNPVV